MRLIYVDALFEVIKKSMAENPHKEKTQRAMHIHEHKYFLTLLTTFPTIQPEPERTMEEFMYGQDMGNPEDGSL